jgi:hypothetical protein
MNLKQWKRFSKQLPLLLVTLLILFVAASSALISRGYEVPDYFVYTLRPGWNFYPLALQQDAARNTCTDKVRMIPANMTSPTTGEVVSSVFFLWSPTEGRYITSEAPSERYVEDLNAGYLYVSAGGAAFVNVEFTSPGVNSCEIYFSSEPYLTVATDPTSTDAKTRLASGWNYVAILPWMVGRTWSDISKNCQIEKAALWDSQNQVWLVSEGSALNHGFDASNKVTESNLGLTLALKVTNDCGLSTE